MEELGNDQKYRFLPIGILVAVLAILVVVLAVLAVREFKNFRNRPYCASVEQDAMNILTSLSCYLSEPKNRSCTHLDSLNNDPLCGFDVSSIYPPPPAILIQYGRGNDAWWQVTVTDTSGRCPLGKSYTAYMGTDRPGAWHSAPSDL